MLLQVLTPHFHTSRCFGWQTITTTVIWKFTNLLLTGIISIKHAKCSLLLYLISMPLPQITVTTRFKLLSSRRDLSAVWVWLYSMFDLKRHILFSKISIDLEFWYAKVYIMYCGYSFALSCEYNICRYCRHNPSLLHVIPTCPAVWIWPNRHPQYLIKYCLPTFMQSNIHCVKCTLPHDAVLSQYSF